MVRTWIASLAAVFAASTMAATADAQGTLSSGSRATSASSGMAGASIGTGIAETAQGFTEATPELRQAQDLRAAAGRSGTFLGADTGNVPEFMGAEQQATSQRGMQQRRFTGMIPQGSRPGQAGAPIVRPRLTVGFAYTPKISPAIGHSTRTCLQRIPKFAETSSIRVSVKQNVVILEGTVRSKRDAMLAVQMVALEPGVVKVDNRLTVADAASPSPADKY